MGRVFAIGWMDKYEQNAFRAHTFLKGPTFFSIVAISRYEDSSRLFFGNCLLRFTHCTKQAM